MMDVLNASTEAFVSPFAQRRQQVAAVLDDLFPTLNGTTRTLVGPGIPTGGNIGVRVHLEEAWLVLDIPLAMTQTPPASWAQIVGLQAALPACVKVVLPKNKPDGPSDLYLRADVALDAEDDPASRVATVATALPVALLLCASAGLTTRNGPMSLAQADGVAPTVQDSIDDASSLEAAKLVAEAGWNYIERSAAEGVVDLQVPGEFRQAELTVRADGIHLAVYLSQANAQVNATESTDEGVNDAVTSEALAGFLLRAGSWVRAVRPALGVPIDDNSESKSPRPCFELIVAPPVSADILGHGLATLAVAARWCLAEAEVLQRNPSLAKAYLRAVGAESREQTRSKRPGNQQNQGEDQS
jgi:hypothetical protein